MLFDAQGAFDKSTFFFSIWKLGKLLPPGGSTVAPPPAANLSHKGRRCSHGPLRPSSLANCLRRILLFNLFTRHLIQTHSDQLGGSVKSICFKGLLALLFLGVWEENHLKWRKRKKKGKRGNPCVTRACGLSDRGELDSDTRGRGSQQTLETRPNLSGRASVQLEDFL